MWLGQGDLIFEAPCISEVQKSPSHHLVSKWTLFWKKLLPFKDVISLASGINHISASKFGLNRMLPILWNCWNCQIQDQFWR